MKYDTTIYTVKYDSKGFPYIEKDIYYERIREFIPEVCGPKGVQPKIWVEQDNINGLWCILQVRTPYPRYASVIYSCQTEDECKNEFCKMLERQYQDSDVSSNDYHTKRDAIYGIAECLELKCEVVESLLHWMDVAVVIKTEQVRKRACIRYVKAIKNCKESGVAYSKELARAKRELRNPDCGAYSTLWGNYKDRHFNIKPISLDEILPYVEKEVLNGRI